MGGLVFGHGLMKDPGILSWEGGVLKKSSEQEACGQSGDQRAGGGRGTGGLEGCCVKFRTMTIGGKDWSQAGIGVEIRMGPIVFIIMLGKEFDH